MCMHHTRRVIANDNRIRCHDFLWAPVRGGSGAERVHKLMSMFARNQLITSL